ncbi:MAG: nuclear transport factor 2 family protein, partial [Planctomycetes bacterium]|nr:nuclear transport factor 2 family protein [Planctomycetota bacterium]
EIELTSEETARGIWSMFDRVDHPSYLLIGYGHYTEQYRKESGEWRIAELVLTRLHETRTPKP